MLIPFLFRGARLPNVLFPEIRSIPITFISNLKCWPATPESPTRCVKAACKQTSLPAPAGMDLQL